MAKRRRQTSSKYKPGYADQFEISEGTVENPYRRGEYERVAVNLRESNLATMHARGQIAKHQFRAGEWVRAQYEQMHCSSMAVDPTNEPVDTSGIRDQFPDRMIRAGQALSKARKHLGIVAWPIVEQVCGQGLSVRAACRGPASRAQVEFAGRLLRKALDELAVYLGYARH